jgi:hypothetical protein
MAKGFESLVCISSRMHTAAKSAALDIFLARHGVGTWRGKGRGPGEGKAYRAQNRKDYDHAISSFASILEPRRDSRRRIILRPVPVSACHAVPPVRRRDSKYRDLRRYKRIDVR